MIGLTFNVDNIDTVLQVYDQIQLIRLDQYRVTAPETPVGQPEQLTDWVVVSGTQDFPVPIDLTAGTTLYLTYDPYGEADDWYSSRYYDSLTGSYSAWSDPILGGEGDLYYDPVYPAEMEYSDEDQLIIDRIRLYIGDPLGIAREFGEEALASLHPDGKTYGLAQKGWPVYITMGGKGFTGKFNPSVNGYRYLKFQELVNDVCYACAEGPDLCGDTSVKLITQGVDIWYYTFRNSDRQIMEAYDTCPPPPGLTTTNATSQAYILQTAIDLLTKEIFEDATEDGAYIKDKDTVYDPKPGLSVRKALLDDLRKQLKDLTNSLLMKGITGVLVD